MCWGKCVGAYGRAWGGDLAKPAEQQRRTTPPDRQLPKPLKNPFTRAALALAPGRWRVHPTAMQGEQGMGPPPGPIIRIGDGPGGAVTYLVDLAPEDLPSVAKRDLEQAWYAAREAALAEHSGSVRVFRFQRPDGNHTDLALSDRDAICWAGAVDRSIGLRSTLGLSLCLRLLALVDLLARAPWISPLYRLARDGTEFHPALLRAAASQPLTSDARFDELQFRLCLARFGTGFQVEAPSIRGTAFSGAQT